MSSRNEHRLQAVIFDFDGVIADSEIVHHRAILEAVKPFGISFDYEEYLAHYIGFDDRDALREACARGGLPVPEGKELERLIEAKLRAFKRQLTGAMEPFPGVRELVTELQSADIPMGIASGAVREEIDLMLAGMKLSAPFRFIVSAGDVAKSKPDPESYLLAMRRLNDFLPSPADPRRCVVIEDTVAGIRAARAANLFTIAVAHSHAAADLTEADHVAASIADLNLETIESLLDR